MATKNGKPREDPDVEKDFAKTYNEFKEFEGKRYTGMKVGRSHKWYYDQGVWKEKKITPEEWEINYAVKKRRAGKAPEGSGVPVGTEYHWYILAHQNVRKLNANDYTTSLVGHKYKLAHKRADNEKWSACDRAQKRKLIKILQGMIDDLQADAETEAKPAETKRRGIPEPSADGKPKPKSKSKALAKVGGRQK
jgi:hypothetical protein